MDMVDDDFKQRVSEELFNITYDINIIRKALLSISEDIQLNMAYCDVLAIVMEENDIASRTDIDTMVIDLNKKRSKRTKEVMSKLNKKLKVVAEEQKSLMDILENAPFKGEA
jgi:uncharacterized membrane protein